MSNLHKIIYFINLALITIVLIHPIIKKYFLETDIEISLSMDYYYVFFFAGLTLNIPFLGLNVWQYFKGNNKILYGIIIVFFLIWVTIAIYFYAFDKILFP
ncbi:MAG: hypothetical protein D8M58_11885 [Calditrichaeota bacterium]|nr:MAG: hypothetical protein DWQ03_12670 [Calditrichota bacterium]MBL1206096.1 hypothetical protein [Calditrichota bacterium]NOG45922.1 hypothetical protein [Calditrichota bacterium]